ncbi:MAG TPA: DUF5317 family protein [Acidimicrobiales bacterium]|nr:DUF5317 family protein [Acidimicrobiales bacterium]
MLLAVLALVAGAAAGWLSGRRLPEAGGTWRALGLAPAGVVLLAVGNRWVGGGAGVAVAAGGYALLIAFAALNSRRTGLVLVAAGLAANLAVIAVDHGMPVRGVPPGLPAPGLHHGLSSRDHLTGLTDTIRLGALHETVSPGDLLVALGGAVALYSWLEPLPGRPRRLRPLRRRRRGPLEGPRPSLRPRPRLRPRSRSSAEAAGS